MAKRRWKYDDISQVLDGENPFKQWGYKPVEKIDRKPGERWVDSKGQLWEQKNGYKIIVNEKADQIRDMIRQKCSKCGMDIRWGNRLDNQFFGKSGMCYNCTIDNDTMMRLSGEWDTYEKKKVLSNQLSYLQDMRGYVKESIDYLSTSDGKLKFVDEMGGVEVWTDHRIEMLLESAKSDYEKITNDIEETQDLIRSLE